MLCVGLYEYGRGRRKEGGGVDRGEGEWFEPGDSIGSAMMSDNMNNERRRCGVIVVRRV